MVADRASPDFRVGTYVETKPINELLHPIIQMANANIQKYVKFEYFIKHSLSFYDKQLVF